MDAGSWEGDWCSQISWAESAAGAVARRCGDFKSGEAWEAIKAALEARRVRPIAADRLVLQKGIEKNFAKALEVRPTLCARVS
jgi:hypothetical protein